VCPSIFLFRNINWYNTGPPTSKAPTAGRLWTIIQKGPRSSSTFRIRVRRAW
jgi:hypothetical protein